MRSLWPTNNTKEAVLYPEQKQPATKEDIDRIEEQINALSDTVDLYTDQLEQFKADIRAAFTTGTLTADAIDAISSTIQTLISNSATITSADITNLTASIATLGGLTVNGNTSLQETSTGDLTVHGDEAVTGNITATGNINAAEATVDTLHANTLDVNTVEFNTFNADTLNADTVNADAIDADAATLDAATIGNATVTELNATKSISPENYNEVIYNRFFNHNQTFNKMSLTNYSLGADNNYFITLPPFKNGRYYVIGVNATNGDYLWSIEVDNSVQNVKFAWSVRDDYNYLRYVEFVKDTVEYMLVAANTGGIVTDIYYQGTDFNTQLAPTIYGTKPVDGTKHFDLTRRNGTYIPNSIFAGEFHAESILIDNVEFESVYVNKHLYVPTSVDQYGEPLGYSDGTPGQYITTEEDNYGHKYPVWETPATSIVEDDIKLVTGDTIFNYDGTAEDGNGDPAYPISELNEDTTVHGNITVEDGIHNPHLFIGTEAEYAAQDYLADDAIVVKTDELSGPRIYRRRVIDNVVTLKPFAAIEPNGTNAKPLIYDSATDTIKTVDALDISELKAHDAVFHDITVSGTAHINDYEEQQVIGNYITLRANNNAALANGEYSGLVVNHYDSNGNLVAILADNTGTLRIGTGTGTKTTYANLYFADNKYYTDAELTTEVTPQGVMTSWATYEKTADYEHWTNAVWTVISFSNAEPLLTRDEVANMTDAALLKWNAAAKKAQTIPAPSADEQFLQATIDDTDPLNPVVGYTWTNKQAGNYIFDTVAQYQAYAATHNIPDKSTIYIRNETDYILGDFQNA